MKRINLSTAFSGIKFNSKKLIFFIIALFSMFSCLVEEEIPETNFEVTVQTLDASSITDSSAVVGVIISSYDKSQVSLTIGVCLNTTGNPTTSDYAYEGSGELGEFTVKITELNAATKYYARAYVTNAAGTTLYGNEVYFTTMPKNTGTVTDVDGNVYQTVKIGSQIWMVENLKTTKYNDGTNIPYVTVDATWVSQITPAYCWLSNSSINYKESYGALYNWYAVNTGKLAPAGWHVPTDAEWSELTNYLGGEIDCAGQLKDKGTTFWLTPNTGANNISGFTGRPGGSRSNDGLFYGVGGYGYWWASTEGNAAGGWARSLTYNTTTVGRLNYYKGCGFSVRCVKGDPLGFPVLTTTAISSISTTSASSGGNITSDGGSTITARGVCWSTKTNPILTDTTKTTNGAGIGNFISTISVLKASTTYYVRAYATNSMGTAYGNEVSFTTSTPAGLPTLSTTTPTSITSTTAAGGGNITSDGGLIVTSRGICWSTAANPTISLTTKTSNGTGIGTFTSSMTGLSANTTYYLRAYATNSAGTAYGTQLSFTTTNVAAALPTLSTSAISSILTTTATSGGNITADGGATVTVKGVCWSTTATPTIANSKTSDGIGTGTFTSSITGLTANTRYYLRAYATNSVGTSYGNEMSFITYTGTVTDIDGNIYNTVTIGTQIWMVENLKTTKYRDGTTIPNVTDGTAWTSLTTGAYCDYNNAASNSVTYGKLYNFYAVADSRNIAPTGWHVPTNKEWSTLTTYLGGEAVAGSKLKEIGIGHWTAPNTEATNESGFTAIPGGRRYGELYEHLGVFALWWTSSQISIWNSYVRTLKNSDVLIEVTSSPPTFGLSVRCLKGELLTTPTLTTSSISAITSTTATGGGNVTSDGGASVTARGVCWSTTSNPTTANSFTTSASGTGSFVSGLTGLTANTTYYVRAYATNSLGTAYGNEISFNTTSILTTPTITTNAVSAITATTATGNGNITSDGGASVTARGVCWSTTTNPTISNSSSTNGSGTGSFVSGLTGLTANITYFVRAFATNSVGTAYGNEVSFTTAKTNGQLLFNENFDYTVGSTLVGQGGWVITTSVTINPLITTPSSIAYSGYPSSGIGQELSIANNGQDINRPFTSQTNGLVYVSALVNISAAQAIGDYFLHVCEPGSISAFFCRAFVKLDGSKIAFGIQNGVGGTPNQTYTASIYDLNTTYLLVMKVDVVTGESSLIVNPALGVEPANGWVSNLSGTNVPSTTGIGTVNIRQGTALNAPTLKLDGIRVATSWLTLITGN
jgi:uncharacterized protein (TIGR02145 family)